MKFNYEHTGCTVNESGECTFESTVNCNRELPRPEDTYSVMRVNLMKFTNSPNSPYWWHSEPYDYKLFLYFVRGFCGWTGLRGISFIVGDSDMRTVASGNGAGVREAGTVRVRTINFLVTSQSLNPWAIHAQYQHHHHNNVDQDSNMCKIWIKGTVNKQLNYHAITAYKHTPESISPTTTTRRNRVHSCPSTQMILRTQKNNGKLEMLPIDSAYRTSIQSLQPRKHTCCVIVNHTAAVVAMTVVTTTAARPHNWDDVDYECYRERGEWLMTIPFPSGTTHNDDDPRICSNI